MTPIRPEPWRCASPSAFALLCLLTATLPSALAGEPGAKPGLVNLRDVKIPDVATTVSVPLGERLSLVARLHEGFWVQCPRYLPVPTSLAGDGLILQCLNARGGSPAIGYLGAEPLLDAQPGEAPSARLERSVRGFVDGLPLKYQRVDWRIAPGKIELSTTTIKVGGKKTPAWRTAPYVSEPAQYGGPRSTFSGQAVLFQPEGTDRLAYVVLDTKTGATTTLDRMLSGLSVQETHAANKSGRVVQLNNVAESQDGRFPVRLLSYESPPGFVFGPGVVALPGELTYAEDRLDAEGRVTAWHRISHRHADTDVTPAQEADDVRSMFGDPKASRPKEVSLATPGTRGFVFRQVEGLPPGASGAATAIVRFDDLTLVFTWTTFGDASLADRDALALERLLSTMQLAVPR